MKARIPYIPTVKEKRAMNDEIKRQIGDNVRKLNGNILACYLWDLHEQEGYGKKRLLRKARDLARTLKELEEYYEMPGDAAFICDFRLRNEVGIDVSELEDVIEFNVRIE